MHRIASLGIAWLLLVGMSIDAQGDQPAVTHPSVTTSGLSASQLATVPGVIFAQPLPDVPGRDLVVVALDFPPNSQPSTRSDGCTGHRHPGSVYVYVTKGTLRLGISGQPLQVVPAGGSFYEPANALHTVAESASATEPASAIAVLILPDGAPILVPNKCDMP